MAVFHVFELCKWYQITQSITYIPTFHKYISITSLCCSDTEREKCPYSVLLWSAFSHSRTEHGQQGVSLRIQSECWKMRTRKIPNTDFLRSDRCSGYSKTWLKSAAFNRGFTVHDCKKNKITSYCYRKVRSNCIICKIKQQLSKVNKVQFKLLGSVEYV